MNDFFSKPPPRLWQPISCKDTSSSDQVGYCGDLKVVALSQSFVSRAVELTYDVGEEALSELPSVAHPDTGNLSFRFRGAGRIQQFSDMNLC